MSDKIYPYKDYASGTHIRDKSEAADPYTVMRVLRRSRSKRVDKFLDWLASHFMSCPSDVLLISYRRRVPSKH